MPKADREFSHSLYRKAALEETQQAYGELLNITFEHTEGNTVATFEKRKTRCLVKRSPKQHRRKNGEKQIRQSNHLPQAPLEPHQRHTD